MVGGYLFCKNCGNYYKLQPGESPDDFDLCECGGELEYLKNINGKFIDSNNEQYIPVIEISSTIRNGLFLFTGLFLFLMVILVLNRDMADFEILLTIFITFTTISSILILIGGKRSFRVPKIRPLKDRFTPRMFIIFTMFIVLYLCFRWFFRLSILGVLPKTVLFGLYLIITVSLVLSVFYYLKFVIKNGSKLHYV